eukprot:3181213-Prymnesium_polylepis.3
MMLLIRVVTPPSIASTPPAKAAEEPEITTVSNVTLLRVSGMVNVPPAYPDVLLITELSVTFSVDPSVKIIVPPTFFAVAFRMMLLVTVAVLPWRAIAPALEPKGFMIKASSTVRVLLSSAYTAPPASSRMSTRPSTSDPALDAMIDVFATIHTSLRTMAKAPPWPFVVEFTINVPASSKLVK